MGSAEVKHVITVYGGETRQKLALLYAFNPAALFERHPPLTSPTIGSKTTRHYRPVPSTLVLFVL
jgi:hypothetical protein